MNIIAHFSAATKQSILLISK